MKKEILVTDLGIVKNSKDLQTVKFQEIIDSAEDDTLLVFPKGIYVFSTIFLKSNIGIKINKGAKILGAENFYDYRMHEEIDYPLYQDASHSFFDCSLFVGKNLTNIEIIGEGIIDMRSVWDLDNVRDIVHRGPKCIALKECDNVKIEGISILNATDLAVYFAGCNNVDINRLNLKVYIDGISPDNSKNVTISNCNVISGDDGIVFKSSYTLNRLDTCENIFVKNCNIQSRCNALKFGTESNGGFKNISIENIKIKNTRITGISIESVDGAVIDNIKINNVKMRNVVAPFFIHLGQRMRGPKELDIGSISNVTISNVKSTGPFKKYKTVAWNYDSFVKNDIVQNPWCDSKDKPWQYTSNVCGLKKHELTNIAFRNIKMKVYGGVSDFNPIVPDVCPSYPEVYVYGKTLPAKGIYFRYVKHLELTNVKVSCYKKDKRKDFVFENII